MKFHVYPVGDFVEHTEPLWQITQPTKGLPINVDKVRSCPPEECDYFVVPMKVKHDWGSSPVVGPLLERCRFYRKHPERHVFFLTHDCCEIIPELRGSVIFQMSCSLKNDTYCCHYKSLAAIPERVVPIGEAIYDVSFQGETTRHACRMAMVEAAKSMKLACCVRHNKFWCSAPDESARQSYGELMNQSKFVLCPRGLGLTSIRFFEALGFGRIPVLIADETKLPLAWKINWDELMVRVPEHRPDLIEGSVSEFMRRHDLSAVSEKCRLVWEKYFADGAFEFFLTENLRGHGAD